MIVKDYKLIIHTPFDKYKSAPQSLYGIAGTFLNILRQYGCINQFDNGEFVTTTNVFTREDVVKRYCLEICVPYTKFEIKKISAGPIDQELFMRVLTTIKENYYDEGI